MHTKTITVDNKKLLEQFANIETLAKRKKWSFYYDGDLDSLYLSPKNIKSDFRLYSLQGGISVYIDKDSNVGGLFIEYYKTNHASHEEKYKGFRNIFTKKIDHLATVSDKDKNKVVVLSQVLKADLLSDMTIKVQAGQIRTKLPA